MEVLFTTLARFKTTSNLRVINFRSLSHYYKQPECEPKFDPNYKTIPSRNHYKRKHWNPKYRYERSKKVIKVKLPEFNQPDPEELSPEEIRQKLKENGVQPPRPWSEKPFVISSTPATFEPYVPPEGDGKMSVVTKAGALQKVEYVEKKGKSMLSLRKIRQYEEDFDPKDFVKEALEIYVNTHKALADFDEDRLHELVTERAYPLVTENAKNTTICWHFINSLEPARVVHIRHTDLLSKENMFAQITVRFHTRQTLAVYDRFGRLQHGSPVVAKDVLEYVVFEKHIANTYGLWRIHDKIIPDWMPPKEPTRRTYVVVGAAPSDATAETPEEGVAIAN